MRLCRYIFTLAPLCLSSLFPISPGLYSVSHSLIQSSSLSDVLLSAGVNLDLHVLIGLWFFPPRKRTSCRAPGFLSQGAPDSMVELVQRMEGGHFLSSEGVFPGEFLRRFSGPHLEWF